ncbi:hypothetical protein H7097_02650 [Aeromicrobium sp.]|nr:hypothetical protein [Candidatus Saccharibacteria bacterium]
MSETTSTSQPLPPSTPGFIDSVPDFAILQVPETTLSGPSVMITDIPNFEPSVPPLRLNRQIIDRIPSQTELEQGDAYVGGEGEFKDAAALLQLIGAYDKDRKLADSDVRAEVIKRATVEDAKSLVVEINKALYPLPAGESNLSTKETTLGIGTGDERKVGTIGVHPEDVDEVLGTVLDTVKKFAADGKMIEAGLVAAEGFVAMQMMKDGNKRTARALYELIAYGYDGSQYDQEAMRKRLGFTQEARRSFSFVSISSRERVAFQQERLPAEQRRTLDWASAYWPNHNDRPALTRKLIGIKDEALRQMAINVLQTIDAGPAYIMRHADPQQLSALRNEHGSHDEAKWPGLVDAVLSGIDDAGARALIEENRVQRKEFLKRLIKSSSDEDKLPILYDYATGDVRDGLHATVIPKPMPYRAPGSYKPGPFIAVKQSSSQAGLAIARHRLGSPKATTN